MWNEILKYCMLLKYNRKMLIAIIIIITTYILKKIYFVVEINRKIIVIY